MIIAVSALGISICEFRAARWQARASVRSHFGITFYWDETGMGWADYNNGLGAARIRGFKLLLDGKAQPAGVIKTIIADALGLNSIAVGVAGLNMRVGTWIKPDSADKLFWLLPGSNAVSIPVSKIATAKLYYNHQRISFEACYCRLSVLNNSFQHDVRKNYGREREEQTEGSSEVARNGR